MLDFGAAPGRFGQDQRGTTAVLFGLCCIGLVGTIGLAVDGGRGYAAKAAVASALDAASLAATRALFQGKNEAEVQQAAADMYLANIGASGVYGMPPGIVDADVDFNSKTVRVSVDTTLPTTFARVLGIEKLDLSTASVSTFAINDLELGLALDVTGSMNKNGKIDALKVAAKNLIDTLMPDGGLLDNARIGLAPYSATVNAGPALAADITDNQSPDGCVFERDGGTATDDTAPGDGTWLSGIAGGVPADIDPKEGVSNYGCPDAVVEPMTDDKNLLKSSIDNFEASGYTAGHLGAAWGWYLVSPEWSSTLAGPKPARAYGTPNLIKAVVLMTDGIFNTAYKNGSSADQALELCENMRAKGVIVYSIAFQAPEDALETLTDCASTDSASGNQLVYAPETAAELNEAFQDIAIKLANLRIAR